jgi:hypothetical protein
MVTIRSSARAMDSTPDSPRTITLTKTQAALLAEVVDDMIDVDSENVAASDIHTAKEIDGFKREVEALRAIRALI